ncbi:MAG: hypothetical protein AB7I19_12495 [Planctomycetota bacterium]
MRDQLRIAPPPMLLLILAVFAAKPAAQDAETVRGWHIDLRSEDPIVLESARRSLAVLPRDRLDRAAIEPGLVDERSSVRRAAASLLLQDLALAPAADATKLTAWLRNESEPSVLLDLVGRLPIERCRELAIAPVRRGDGEPEPIESERIEAASELRRRAFVRAARESALTPADWRVVLTDADDAVGQFAAQCMVEAIWPLPIERLDELPPLARSRTIEALGDRPRAEAVQALRRMLESGDLSPLDRLSVLVALGTKDWKDADAKSLLQFAMGEDDSARRRAESVCRYLPPAAANRLIAQVQLQAQVSQEGWNRGAFGSLLDLLHNIDARGERLLFSIAREVAEGPRDEIAAWLSRRGSEVVPLLIEEAFAGDYPLSAAILRGAKDLMGSAAVRARVLEVLTAGMGNPNLFGGDGGSGESSPSLATCRAAFDLLCEAGVFDPVMLDFALVDNDEEQVRKLSMLLRLDESVVMSRIVPATLARATEQPLRFLLTQLVRVDLSTELERSILQIDRSDLRTARAVDHLLLSAGTPPVMEAVWNRLDRAMRIEWLDALRERGDEAAVRLIAAEPLAGSFDAFHFAKLAIGDRTVLDALLAEPGSWPRTWLRRAESAASRLLTQSDVDSLVERLPTFSDPIGAILLQWIARRPDLDDRGLPRRLYAEHGDDLTSEVRVVALRIELVRSEFRDELGARLRAKIATGFDERAEEEAFEWFGSNPGPLADSAARMLVDFAVAESLARPHLELETALNLGPPLAEPRIQLAFQRTIREECPAAVTAWSEGLRAAAGHPFAHLAAQSRLLRVLEILARSPSLRSSAAPILARWLVDLPDFEVRALGPAWQVLAEQHEGAERFAEAATAWDHAAFAYLTHGVSPLVQRVLLGDASRADRDDPTAWLWSRSSLCECKAALAAGNVARARVALELARARADGDRRAEADVEALRKELER